MLDRPATWLELLEAYRVPLTPRAALDYLSQQSARFAILGCYRIFFPTEWAASTAPLLPDPDSAYSARELEFFQLVDQHLFPLDTFWIGDLNEDPENRTLALPLIPIGLDWEDSDPADYRLGIQMLLVLAGAIRPHDTMLSDPVIAALHAVRAGRGQPLWPPATILRRPPLTALTDAYAWVWRDTGNAWLDATYEMPIEVEWTRAEVEWCATEYRAAQALLAAIDPLLAWLEAAPAHLLEVLAHATPTR